jgi:hypothetical protein
MRQTRDDRARDGEKHDAKLWSQGSSLMSERSVTASELLTRLSAARMIPISHSQK